MANLSKEVPRIEYSQLSEVLTDLGFVRTETEQFIVFGEQEHDALIVLPKMQADTVIGDPYLVTVRNTVVGKGIVSREEVEALLNGSSDPPTQDRPKPKPNRQTLAGKRRRPGARSRAVSPLP